MADVDARIAKAQGVETPAPEDDAAAEPPVKEVPEGADGKPAKPDVHSQETEVPKTFTERAEWQRLTALADKLGKPEGAEVRKALRGFMERETGLTKQIEQARPQLAAVQELIAETGNEQGFQNLRLFVKQYNAEPVIAIPMLEKLLQDAKTRAGLVVTSPDLLTETQKVDQAEKDGVISAEQAAQRRKEITELETSRAALKRTQSQTQAQKDAAAQEAMQARQNGEIAAIEQTEAAWLAEKQAGDPDFAIVSPLFGKLIQLAAVNFKAEQKRNPSAAEAKQLLETTYKEAKAEALRFKPKPRAITPARSNGTSTNVRHQPTTEMERFEQRLAEAKRRNGS